MMKQDVWSEQIDLLFDKNEIFKKHQLIRSPEVFTKLIMDLENDPLTLKEIAKLSCASEISLMHIYASQDKQHTNILDVLLQKYFEFGSPDELFGLIWAFLQFVSPSRSNFRSVLSYVKEKFYDQQCTPSNLNKILNLLELMISEKKHTSNEPRSQFIFNGHQSQITIQQKPSQLPFQKGFTLYIWIKIQEQFQTSSLISTFDDQNGFEFLIEGNKLIYRSLVKQSQKRIGLVELPTNRWFLLILSVDYLKSILNDGFYIKVTCESNIVEGIKVDFPQQMNQQIEFKMCSNLYGQISSILLFQGAVPHKLQCGDSRFGVQDNSQVKDLMRTLGKYQSKLLLCYSPIRGKQKEIIDFSNNRNGQLSQQSSILIKETSYQLISQVCKLENFIPLFQFLNTFTPQTYPDLLNQLIKIMTLLFRTRPEVQQDAVQCDLLSIIALFINQYGLNYISQKTIEGMQEMKNSLLEKQLKNKYLLDFVWKIQFQKFKDFEVTKIYLNFVRACYNSHPEYYTEAYGVRKILDQAQSIEHSSQLCCDEHARQVGITDYKDDKIPLKDRLSSFMNVLEAILYYFFFDKSANKHLKMISFEELLSTFSQRHSPCYYTEVLSLILRLYKFEKIGHHPVSSLLAKEESLRNITYVLTFCNCPKVKTGCIKLIAEAIRTCGYDNEMELGIWIGHTLGNTAAAEQMGQSDNKLKLIIDYEPLYVAVMEWCLRRQATHEQASDFVILDTDLLSSISGLHLLMCLYSFANDSLRSRVIIDLCILASKKQSNYQYLFTQINKVLESNELQLMVSQPQFQFTEEFPQFLKTYFEDASILLSLKRKDQDSSIKSILQQFEDRLVDSAQLAFTQQEEARLRRMDTHEAWLRNAKYTQKKCWNQVRIFNEIWAHPSFSAQNDKLFESLDFDYQNLEQNNNFTWKVWKYQTKQMSRPLLKIKLNDIINQVDQTMEEELVQQRELNLFRHDSFEMVVDEDKKQQKINPQTIMSIFNGIKNQFSSTQQKEDEETFINKVIWIKTLTVRYGQLKLRGDKLIQKVTHQGLVKFKVPDEGRLIKEWDIGQFCDIVKRRYIGRRNSLELFFLDGSSLVFSFPEENQDLLIDKLCSNRKSKCFSIKPHISSSQTPFQIIQSTKSLQKWYAYELTTFEYLMKLNKISGRSYKDLTQYHVVPWIMDGGDQLGCYRDLTKSMGALGNTDRTDVFRQRYDMIDHFNKVPQYHFGSHYSNPAIVFHYLIRLRPYADGARELQSGKFDLADRLFFNFVETYRNATEELSDVRELIPEFYYLPEMFVNHTKYDFGLQQTGVRVNNVELPDWCQQNPYKFICGHRYQLETDYVSQHINQWIDLIFGYKQKGEQAASSLNTFYYLTYEDSLDFNSLESEKLKVSYESQMVHFGQTPCQIFEQKHPQRPARKFSFRINDEKCKFKVFRSKYDQTQLNRSRSISTIYFISENKFFLSKRNGDLVKMRIYFTQNQLHLNLQYEIVQESEYHIDLARYNDEGYIYDYNLPYEELPKLFIKGGKVYIAIGGVWDGRLIIYNVETSVVQNIYYEQTDTITAIGSDKKQRIIATGSKSGRLCIYSNFQWQNSMLKCIAIQNHHNQMITSVFICNDLKAVISCSLDGTINLYNMYTGRFLRSYQHPKMRAIDYVCIFTTPLYGIAFYCSEELMLYSYSINGQFLSNYSIDACGKMLISKDCAMNDVLCIATNNGKKVIQLNTPFLIVRQEIKLTSNSETMAGLSVIAVSPNCNYMAFGTRDGEVGIVLDSRIQ